ncbi:DNA-processing protein DprA [Rhizosaccharibacter radicis]|uniref:DNA-processing protein DprA n=1 Tax=Rhizosaccharibacter radicis TaxID=2782605 RepID=A0ABT1W1T8_9PROT|nr:DNA-processing protein DprA [Acetobacteraceae bacterium KSS12]
MSPAAEGHADRPLLLGALRLSRCEGVGPVTFRRLMQRFPTAEEAIDALPELARRGGRDRGLAIASPGDAERELDALEQAGGRLLLLGGPDYPPLLAQLPDAPPVLSVLGDPAVLRRRGVAIVGARNASAAGMRMAEMLAADLAAAGLVVVSGLARGIDGAAHRATLPFGPTVAAIAGGLDQPYPPEHAGLQNEIAARGCVLTEAPLGTAPQSRHFPRRNRIIVGVSLGCVVVEASPRSGSLITAGLARDYHRELFAVPGSPLDPRSAGPNGLIREGATLVEGAADVLRHLPELLPDLGPTGFAEGRNGWGADGPEAWTQLGEVRRAVLPLLGPTPVPVDDLVRRCQFSTSAVLTVLTELELAGRVESLPGNRVSLLAAAARAV